MDCELIAIGEPQIIQEIISGLVYSQEDNIFLISVPSNLLKYIVNQCKSSNVETVEYSEYLKIINATCTNQPIDKIKSEEASKWFASGVDFFYTTTGNCFEMHSIEKKDVRVVSSVGPITKGFMSKDGNIYGFIRGQSVSFYIGDDLQLIWDIKLDSFPVTIDYSESSKYVAITLSTTVLIYNLFKGSFLGCLNTCEFVLYDDFIYINGIDKTIDLSADQPFNSLNDLKNLSLKPKGLSCSAFCKNRKVRFVDDALQKIIFNDGVEIIKNHTNIKNINFYFAENRLFALIVKNPGKEEHFSIESYLNNEITSNSFTSKIIQFSASDNFLVVQLANFTVLFFIKEKHAFRLINTIKKNESVLLSVKNYICVLYCNNILEFYDKENIKASFSHFGCTNIKWSESGLYVAAYSYSANLGTVVQIFNCNCSLMFKKVFNSLRDFNWRSFPEIPENEKKTILSEHSLDEIEEVFDAETLKKQVLLKEWKEYLLSKIN